MHLNKLLSYENLVHVLASVYCLYLFLIWFVTSILLFQLGAWILDSLEKKLFRRFSQVPELHTKCSMSKVEWIFILWTNGKMWVWISMSENSRGLVDYWKFKYLITNINDKTKWQNKKICFLYLTIGLFI